MPGRRSADLPLHSGAAPAWLFRRMVDLTGAIGTLIVRDAGPQELLRRLSTTALVQLHSSCQKSYNLLEHKEVGHDA